MKNTRNHEYYLEKVGTVSVSMYKEKITDKPLFFLQLDNENMLQVSYVIEDTLKMF